MLQIFAGVFFGILVIAAGVGFIHSAEAIADISQGRTYPPTVQRADALRARLPRWLVKLGVRFFGLQCICGGLILIALAIWPLDPVDDCLDAGARWNDSAQLCEGARGQ